MPIPNMKITEHLSNLDRASQLFSSGNYTIIPNVILTLLTGEKLRTWLFMWAQRTTYNITKATLMRNLGMSRSTAIRMLQDLVDSKFAVVSTVSGPSGPMKVYVAVLPAELTPAKK